MNINVKQKTLSQEFAGNPGRIVLGGWDDGLVVIMLSGWIAFTGFAGIVLFAQMTLSTTSSPGRADLQAPLTMMVVPIAFFYLLGGWKSRLTLDLSARTYLHEYGLTPFVLRRQGRLEAFDHLCLTREEWTSFKGGPSTVWKLTLTPREGAQASLPGNATAVATAPLVLLFSGASDQIIAFSQKLSQAAALPFHDQSQQLIPPAGIPARVGWAILLVFVGLIGLGNAYSWYESRGARFPVRYGTPLLIHYRMGACTARSLEVKAGLSRRETSGSGEPPHTDTYFVTPYSITLDIENTGSKLSTLNFVVGFDASHRTDGSSGPLQPHTHCRVTVNLEAIGNPPDNLFLR